MLRKIMLYLTASIAIAIYVLAGSRTFMLRFSTFLATTNVKGLQWDKFKNGDLYGLSHLRAYKRRTEVYHEDRRIEDTAHLVNLWCIGDSYLAFDLIPQKSDGELYGTRVSYFYFPIVEFGPHPISIKNNKRNVLLIECLERNIYVFFKSHLGAKMYRDYLATDSGGGKVAAGGMQNILYTLSSSHLPPKIMNQNLEVLLFGYEFFSPLKEAKASIDYNLFGRIANGVYQSKNNVNLYFRETVDSTDPHSSFFKVTNTDVDSIVGNINAVCESYKKRGFDEVVFSITPNPVTIVEGGLYHYNNLIPMVQQHAQLNVPVINVYDAFKKSNNPASLYWPSDSHWNSNGFKIWMDSMNAYLKTYITKAK